MVRTVEGSPVGGTWRAWLERWRQEAERWGRCRDILYACVIPPSRCGSPLPSSRRQGGCGGIPPGGAGTVQSWVTSPTGQQGGLRDGGRQAMEAPSTRPTGHPWRSAVNFGQLLTGVELEVIIHGDVGSQHLQVQRVRIL